MSAETDKIITETAQNSETEMKLTKGNFVSHLPRSPSKISIVNGFWVSWFESISHSLQHPIIVMQMRW